MASAFDVAQYIMKKLPAITHMKLQKLLYYSQAWSIVWDEEQLFSEKIEAWSNGPVVPEIYHSLKGRFRVSPQDLHLGDPTKLSPEQRETVDAVVEWYGKRNAQWLSDLTHMEAPWRDVRRHLPPGARSSAEITAAALEEYYSSL